MDETLLVIVSAFVVGGFLMWCDIRLSRLERFNKSLTNFIKKNFDKDINTNEGSDSNDE